MPVDACFADLLREPRNELRRPPPRVTIDDVRKGSKAILMQAPAPAIHAVESLVAPGPAGPLPLRLYRPGARRDLPAVVFFHGGGFMLGDLDSHDAFCREIALAAGCIVVAVDYRLAPEARFPGAVDDCHAALAWVATNASALGIDGTRLAVVGDSAGGNLAIAAASAARRHGPAVRYLALFYPMLDPACSSMSALQHARGFLLTREALQWFWENYLGAPGDATDPRAAPLLGDAAGLPPTTLVTAGYDPLRDEGLQFADHLRAAGVPVIDRRYDGMVHGFATMTHLTPVARQAIAAVAEDLRAALTR